MTRGTPPAGVGHTGHHPRKLGRPAGNYTQYRRLSQLRDLLENHPKGISLLELGRKLRVTDRSIRRYLRELEREIDIERSPDPEGLGGVLVRIPTRDLPRRVKLHRTQIYGLLMARRVFKMLDGTVFEDALRDCVDQLLAHVQRAPRRGATVDPDTRLEDRFLYLPATPMRPLSETPEIAEAVDTLFDACAQLRVCTVRYRSPAGRLRAKTTRDGDGVETLTIHPYAVVLYKDTIYVVCWVKERDGIRTLRVDRIVDADADPLQHFELPDGFSVDAHFAGAFGLRKGEQPTRVVIEFHPRVAELVQSRAFPGEAAGKAVFEPLKDGGVRLRMLVGDTTEVRSWVLSFGETAKVIEPEQLAADVVREMRAALAAYEGSEAKAEPRGEERARNAAPTGRRKGARRTAGA